MYQQPYYGKYDVTYNRLPIVCDVILHMYMYSHIDVVIIPMTYMYMYV